VNSVSKSDDVTFYLTPGALPEPSAHVLARDLAARVSAPRRILVVGYGSGRNLAPLLDAGLAIDLCEGDVTRAAAAAQRYGASSRVRIFTALGSPDATTSIVPDCDGALSTHALLHGNAAGLATSIASIHGRLRGGAPFYTTLGSTRDPRFGRGLRIDAATFAPDTGTEAGVPHVFLSEREVRAMLRDFTIESLDEIDASEHVGAWAHEPEDAATIVHWFLRARRDD